jgi:hypothetical protein
MVVTQLFGFFQKLISYKSALVRGKFKALKTFKKACNFKIIFFKSVRFLNSI